MYMNRRCSRREQKNTRLRYNYRFVVRGHYAEFAAATSRICEGTL